MTRLDATRIGDTKIMIEKLLAAVGFALCVAMLLRMCVGPHRRRRMDGAARRAWMAVRIRLLRLWHWRATRREAAREAEDAIRRARARHERDGNVLRPDAFREPRKPH
jgi:hypothetical protein